MAIADLHVNAARLQENLEELAKIGRNESGGIDRQLASPADSEARAWLKDLWEKIGLGIRTDAIANLWGKPRSGAAEGRPIVLGSHHDTVPNGGAYDGALGVLMATEVVQTLIEGGAELRHPVWTLSMTGEEPSDFSVSTLGSKVLCGRLVEKDLEQIRNRVTGEKLETAIHRLGGDIHRVAEDARLEKGRLAAFIECHIEQGRRLYDAGENIAAVTCITGIYREILYVHGEANHAGTTQLHDRRDALAAASDIVLAVEDLMREAPDLAATVGHIQAQPNASNIVPAQVMLTLDLRTANPETRAAALEHFGEAVRGIEQARGVVIERKLNLDQAEMPMDGDVVRAIGDAAEALGEPRRELVSMAGHDAANLARLTKAGMIFVSTVSGYSHCPQEAAPEKAVAVAAQAMLETVLLLDRRLPI